MKMIAVLVVLAAGISHAATINYSSDTDSGVALLSSGVTYAFTGTLLATFDTIPGSFVTVDLGSLVLTVDPEKTHNDFSVVFPITYMIDDVTNQSGVFINLSFSGGWTYIGQFGIATSQPRPHNLILSSPMFAGIPDGSTPETIQFRAFETPGSRAHHFPARWHGADRARVSLAPAEGRQSNSLIRRGCVAQRNKELAH